MFSSHKQLFYGHQGDKILHFLQPPALWSKNFCKALGRARNEFLSGWRFIREKSEFLGFLRMPVRAGRTERSRPEFQNWGEHIRAGENVINTDIDHVGILLWLVLRYNLIVKWKTARYHFNQCLSWSFSIYSRVYSITWLNLGKDLSVWIFSDEASMLLNSASPQSFLKEGNKTHPVRNPLELGLSIGFREENKLWCWSRHSFPNFEWILSFLALYRTMLILNWFCKIGPSSALYQLNFISS